MNVAFCWLLPVERHFHMGRGRRWCSDKSQIPAAGTTARSEEKISRMRVDTLHARVRILVYEYLETSHRER